MNNILITDLQGFTQELQALRDKIAAMETTLQSAKDEDPLRTFDVVLRVTTHASTWGAWVDCDKVRYHFSDFNEEIKEAVLLTDPGDSVKVQEVTEVT
jgi:hypothetical protein